jgi:hypothetical protein
MKKKFFQKNILNINGKSLFDETVFQGNKKQFLM